MGEDPRVVEIEGFHFYHTVDLLDGTRTKGEWDHRDVIQHYGIPKSLHGKTAIDVGCRDGFFALELEKRGAEVMALDVDDRKERRWLMQKLNSRIIFIHDNIYEFWRGNQKFDLVFCADVIMHVENPLKLLRCLHAICKEKLILVLDKSSHDWVRDEKCKQLPLVAINNFMVPWHFNNAGIVKLLSLAGWSSIEHVSEFYLEAGDNRSQQDKKTRILKMVYRANMNPTFKIYDWIGGNFCDVGEAPLKRNGLNDESWSF